MNCEAQDLPLEGNVSGGKRLLSQKRKKGWNEFWCHLVSLILIFLVPDVCVISLPSLDYIG